MQTYLKFNKIDQLKHMNGRESVRSTTNIRYRTNKWAYLIKTRIK